MERQPIWLVEKVNLEGKMWINWRFCSGFTGFYGSFMGFYGGFMGFYGMYPSSGSNSGGFTLWLPSGYPLVMSK